MGKIKSLFIIESACIIMYSAVALIAFPQVRRPRDANLHVKLLELYLDKGNFSFMSNLLFTI